MTDPYMCCVCPPDPTIDCQTPDICARVTLAGVEPTSNPVIYGDTGAPGGTVSGEIITLAGVNRTHLAGSNYDSNDGLNPVLCQMACGHPAYPSDDADCPGLGLNDPLTSRTLTVLVGFVCVADELLVASVSAAFDGDSPDEFAGPVFEWAASPGTGVPIGTAVPNQLDDSLGGGSYTSVLGINGTATVQVTSDAACEPTVEYAIAEACDAPGKTIVVDLATNVGDKPGLIYQGENYFLTPDTSPDTPVGVTWTDELCPELVMSDWYLATRCPPPGRLNGVWPDPIRYYSPSGPNLDDAIYLNFEDSPRPNCQTSIRYQPTNTPTDEALPIGVRIDGITPCSGTDIRICDDDTGEPPQNVCDICANVGPGSPAWLIAYCENANCLESEGGGGDSMMMAAPASRPTQRRTTRSNGRLWTRRQMVASYAKARRSGRHATPQTIALRQLSCFGDQARGIEPCPRLIQRPDGKGSMGSWCGACGCGVRKAARLDEDHRGLSKLQFTNLDCPLGRPGFSNHDPGETPDSGIREG